MKIHELGWSKEWGGVRLGAVLDLAQVPCPATNIRQVNQIHGCRVSDDHDWHAEMEADGLWTATPGIGLVIRTADCVPVHLVDPSGVATIHAGWRGTRAGILKEAMARFTAKESIAVIGPAICREHYQVDRDLYADWVEEDPDVALFLSPSGNHASKRQFDLQSLVRHQLVRLGVTPERIHSVDKCTFGNATLPSYRRNKTPLRIYNYTMRLPA